MEQHHHNRTRSPYNCLRPEGCLDTAAAAVTDATLAPRPRVYFPLARPDNPHKGESRPHHLIYSATSAQLSSRPTLNDRPTRNSRPKTYLHGDPNRLTALGVFQDVTH